MRSLSNGPAWTTGRGWMSGNTGTTRIPWSETPRVRIWFVTTKAQRTIAEADFRDGDFLLFGKESAGIPESILATAQERCVRIPMRAGERSLNLSNAVAITLYEALRQADYTGLEKYSLSPVHTEAGDLFLR